jgi:6-phosphogluconolactonase
MDQRRAELKIVADEDALAHEAARRIRCNLALNSGRFAICLTGGSSPERLYQTMAAEPFRSTLPWDRVHWFWGDDRFVAQSDPRSNAGMARRLMLDRLPVREEMIHAIPMGLANLDDAAREYEHELQRFYGGSRIDPARPLFDIVLMGLGRDAHTASLFPGRPQLEERQRWAIGVPDPGLEPFVPRVTLTFPVLAATRAMLFLVSGQSKRDAATRVLAGEDLPAGRAHSNGTFVWLMDRAAAPEGHNDAA